MTQPPIGEFERIARFFAPLAAPGGLGLTDDAAVIEGPAGFDLILTTDAIVEGVHFLSDDPPFEIAQKLLRVNLSDLAAKGAAPLGYLLTTALPKTRDEVWLERFAAGLAADQARFGIGLLGGDSVATPGALTLSLTAIGRVSRGAAVLRRGARTGDGLYVSGTLGDAALGLRLLRGELPPLQVAASTFLAERYRLPRPRLSTGRHLVGIAHAMLDISDGLVGDVGHLAKLAGLAVVIESATIPLSPAFRMALAVDRALLALALTGGDDYELAFAASLDEAASLAALDPPCTMIGRFERGEGVRVIDEQGNPLRLDGEGYRHF
ncbi:MAG TPA: thiamine-phosphate kinase [Stellaceae bacterium]|nr:thiamine-phosphate kinase [Stellaceae bacterium]